MCAAPAARRPRMGDLSTFGLSATTTGLWAGSHLVGCHADVLKEEGAKQEGDVIGECIERRAQGHVERRCGCRAEGGEVDLQCTVHKGSEIRAVRRVLTCLFMTLAFGT